MTEFRCLAVETATDLAGVALGIGSTVIVREARGEKAPSRIVYEWIASLFAEAGIRPGDLDCVAFGAGPGSFTGIRVAAAVAQSMAYAHRLPVCPVSTLAALAATAMEQLGVEHVFSCLDARMGQVYAGAYARDAVGGVRAEIPDMLCAPGSLRVDATARYLAAGPGWLAYPAMAAELGARIAGVEDHLLPTARSVLTLARTAFAEHRTVTAFDALPNYLRDKVTV
jgi:tRNA threonylcarbamoyladenosine biosynthesis protein TsaB